MKLLLNKRIASYSIPVRLGIFILALLLIWLPFAVFIHLRWIHNPNFATILTMGLLFGEFLFLLQAWNQRVYQNPRWLKRYGLVLTKKNGIDLLKGLSIGLIFTLSLFTLEGIFGWLQFKIPSPRLLQIIAEGLLSALGIGLAEELLFRGWLLDELQRDYTPQTALWTDAIVFALIHFLKPLAEVIRNFPTLPALIILGLILVWAKRSHSQRLGICIGLHAGLIWGYYILNVGQLIKYTQKVPPWITGIDGNPIAGIMGLIFLGILAFWMRKQSKIQISNFKL